MPFQAPYKPLPSNKSLRKNKTKQTKTKTRTKQARKNETGVVVVKKL
ncbi:phage protein [Bacillus thuringiensis serovar kurstaki str. YBT-1520]|nr:phage protein [Bacillus thuringiensis serovar kurstaki str. YBT-1520]